MADVFAEFERRRDTNTVRDGARWYPCDIQGHLQFMHDTVRSYDRPVVVELGVQAGNSTSALLSAAALAGGTLCSVDLQTREELESRPEGDRVCWWGSPNWKTLLGTSDLSAEALEWLPDTFDVLFVDSDHSEEHAYTTLRAYMPRLKPGGTALFHDTHYVHDFRGDVDLGRPDGWVGRALARYCAEQGLEWENRTGFYGMGVIRR